MRKISPIDVKDSFDSLITEVEEFYNKAEVALRSDKDKSLLAENTFLSSAVLWEGFLSDLFIAYINRDSTEYEVHLTRSFEQNLEGKQKRIYDSFGRLNFPSHLDKATVTSLLDEQGFNVTFFSSAQMKQRANVWLSQQHRQGIRQLTNLEQATIDAWICIRNYIAHRSKGAIDRMNDALVSQHLNGTGLQRGQNQVYRIGAFLKAQQAGRPRLLTFVSYMKAIAVKI